ncbi:MAG: hypothetical protein AABZ67_01425, partial [Pseudomonadota bacterium]
MTEQRWHRVAILAAAILLNGCESIPNLFTRKTPETAEDAANIYVSAYPAVPWADIGDKLEPKHNLTTEQARGMAAQTTQVQVFQFLSTFAAGLGIGLPAKSESTSTSLAADGTQTTTASRTRGTGTPPGSSGIASTAIADAALAPDLSRGPLSLGLDANTALTAGTAVYQLGQILDNQISKGHFPKGYQAHLITFQVNLQPKSRSYAYDTYVNISLLPGSWKEALDVSRNLNTEAAGLPPIVVYPLIITDALESTSTGRSLEVIRQAALQLLGVIGAVGVNAGISGGTDRLESVIGTDKNSLVTLGRVSDHSVRIRLGAQNSGSSGLAMVPRTHNVSLVVLTRWNETNEEERVRSLSAITHSSLMPSDGGEPLTSGGTRSRQTLADQVEKAIASFGFGPVPDTCSALMDASGKVLHKGQLTEAELPGEIRISKYLDLLRAVERADYTHVKKCLGLGEKLDVHREITLRRVLSRLIEIQSSSRYSTISIPLKAYPHPALPESGQLVLLTDDGKSASTFVLRGGKGLRPDIVKAELSLKDLPPPPQASDASKNPRQKQLKPARRAATQQAAQQPKSGGQSAAGTGAPYTLLPAAVKIIGGGAEVQVSFASLAALKLGLNGDKPLKLILQQEKKSLDIEYAVRAVTKTEVKGTPNPVRATSSVLVADGNGLARVTLQVGKLPEGFAAPMRLVISGADVREDKTIGAPGLASKGVTIASESPVTLSLGNLTLSRTVSIATHDSSDKPIGSIIATVAVLL